MMNCVIGSRSTQISSFQTSSTTLTSSPQMKRVQVQGAPVASPTGSPMSRLSRSYALVQATKKKQEDLIKSISDAASCPNLFETPRKDSFEKRSCLKTPGKFFFGDFFLLLGLFFKYFLMFFSIESGRKSRRLSFADSVVTDQLYYCVSEPSSYVGRDLSLRKKAAAEENSSSDESSQQSLPVEENIVKEASNNSEDNSENIPATSGQKRHVLCHQSSIIMRGDEQFCDDITNGDSRNIPVLRDYSSILERDDGSNDSIDSQTIRDEVCFWRLSSFFDVF